VFINTSGDAGRARQEGVVSALFEKVGVDRNVGSKFIGDCRFFINGFSWACRLASSAIDALVWVYKELLIFIIAIFALSRMNAINGTNVNA